MKGVIDVEFFLAVVVFVVVISFVSILIVSNVPVLRSASLSNDLKARAYQSSYQLVFYKGLNRDGTNTNWNANDVSQIGLASERYRLSMAKVNELHTLCTGNYERFRELLGQDFRRVIVLNITTQTRSWNCGPSSVTDIGPEFKIVRLASLNGETAKISLSVI